MKEETFLKLKEDIKIKGFEKVLEEEKEKLRVLFKEMLSYKNKSFSDAEDFFSLLNKVYYDYHYFESDFQIAKTAIKYHQFSGNSYYEEEPVDISEERVIFILRELNMTLKDEKRGYKKYANYYEDYNLYDDKQYMIILKEEIKKFENLLKEVLDFLHVEYNKTDDFTTLLYLTIDNYPYYKYYLFDLKRNLGEPILTVIEKLHIIKQRYNKIKSTYKDYDINSKKEPLP